MKYPTRLPNVTTKAGKWCLIVFLASVTAGCGANFNSIHRTTAADKSKIIFTDAKQSATLVQLDRDGTFKACAAKSPDVFQALSTAFGGSGDGQAAGRNFALALSGSSAESAASFGLRTQLTQSQTELLYQLCINALNGNLEPDQLATELHRYQNTMVTMLGIEQITGYARPTAVALGGGSSKSGKAEELVKLAEMVAGERKKEETLKQLSESKAAEATRKEAEWASAKKALDELSKAESTKKKEEATAAPPKAETGDSAAITAAKKKEQETRTDRDKAKAEAAEAAKKQSEQEMIRKDIESLLEAARADINTNTTGATAKVVLAPTQPSTTDAIAEAVVAMQQTHLSQTFIADECGRYLFRPSKRDSNLNPREGAELRNFCKNYIHGINTFRLQQLYLRNGCDITGKQCTNKGTSPSAGKTGDTDGHYYRPFSQNPTPEELIIIIERLNN